VNLYTRKKRWKIFLSSVALIIISASIYYTNKLVNEFAQQERDQIRVWADAVQQRANLMNYTESFFNDVRTQERNRVELLTKAYRYVIEGTLDAELTLALEIINNNTSIPVIITDERGKIIHKVNLEPKHDTLSVLHGEALEDFLIYDPFIIMIPPRIRQYLYYRESIIFTELKKVLDDLVSSFMTEVAVNAASVPVIITDSTGTNVLQFGNLPEQRMEESDFVVRQLKIMASENRPIQVNFLDHGTTYIYYKSSDLLLSMRFFPMIQILVIALFLLIAYLLFSYARKSEQNQVWAGMAKETAHQIGTPLSSMMAWLELLKMDEQSQQNEAISEMEKDITRLENISERFSKIGSPPKLEPSNLIAVVEDTIDYLRPRTSKKIEYQLSVPDKTDFTIPLNAPLFMWVIENLCKNAIDAMSGHGVITIQLKRNHNRIIVDISDTGKGMSKSEFKSVFNPGYTSKKRGWGLGLSLAKRIIRDYHRGKIFVKSSVQGEGTTFRIILKLS
jgi:signal transduction histidine kinase